MFKRGSSVSTISKMLKLHRIPAYRVIRRFGETGGIENRPKGRPRRTARSSALRKAVKDKLHRNPARSVRKLAKEHNVSRSTMQRLIRDDLGLYPYKLAKGQHLTEEKKATRPKKCRKMKALTRDDKLNRIIFTEEMIFTVEPLQIAQNQRKFLISPSSVNIE
ncbi:unnamed protein product [Heligmosomoides polygyrus]|uniref:HTH_Tnp_Tc3_2 domain-containing protein n=1 Tax=Heligmosomoides polygyrus TaxID=6339 RepID=A0A183F628_HELPZ|nr:unnamed protein product [Heligmosomoides polygyrus]